MGGQTYSVSKQTAAQAIGIAVLMLVPLVSFGGSPWLDGPPSTSPSPTVGRLLLREVYDLDGQKIGLDESTDRVGEMVKAKAKAACEMCGPKCCCKDCDCSADSWNRDCCAVPEKARAAYLKSQQTYAPAVAQPFFTQGTIAPSAAVRSTSWPGSTLTAPIPMYAMPAAFRGVTSNGCATGG